MKYKVYTDGEVIQGDATMEDGAYEEYDRYFVQYEVPEEIVDFIISQTVDALLTDMEDKFDEHI